MLASPVVETHPLCRRVPVRDQITAGLTILNSNVVSSRYSGVCQVPRKS